jgi:hypothetical protein
MRDIKKEIIGSLLFAGILLSNSGVGGSVAKAKAAMVSIIKLTHRSWIAVIPEWGILLPEKVVFSDVTKTMTTAL